MYSAAALAVVADLFNLLDQPCKRVYLLHSRPTSDLEQNEQFFKVWVRVAKALQSGLRELTKLLPELLIGGLCVSYDTLNRVPDYPEGVD